MLKNQSQNKGQTVLVFVLMVVALLLIFFARSIHVIEVEQTITENSRLNKMAENAYQNTIQNAIWLLESDARRKAENKKSSTSAVDVDSLFDVWNKGPDNPYREGDVTIRWRIVDAHSYFPVNTLIGAGGNVNEDNRTRWQELLVNLKINKADKLTASLADWLDPALPDPDADPATATATDPADENFYEEGARNGALLTLAEIKMVPGYSKDVLQGNKEDGRIGLLQYLTVSPITQVNPNTAPAWVIATMHINITARIADRIVNSRSSTPHETMEAVQSATGAIEGVDFNSIFLLKSRYFYLEMESEYLNHRQKKRVLLSRVDSNVTIEKVENIGIFEWDEDLIKKMDEADEMLIESSDN